jgi:cytochrome c-type biogenesis protein CcmH
MKKTLQLLALLAFFIAFTASATSLSNYTFDSPEQEEEFRALTAELRCLVCQNQSLADSDAELADDLRREVYELFKAGKSNEEISTFLTDRYGDFVLYDPPLKPSTYVLWFTPLFMFLIGCIMLVRTLRKKTQSQETTLSEEEQRRLDALLSETSDSDTQDSNK